MKTYINKNGALANRYSTDTIHSYAFTPQFPDNSVENYKEVLLDHLREFSNNYSTHSMNEGALRLQGELEMLNSIISLIEKS